jgi:hypothetical protein
MKTFDQIVSGKLPKRSRRKSDPFVSMGLHEEARASGADSLAARLVEGLEARRAKTRRSVSRRAKKAAKKAPAKRKRAASRDEVKLSDKLSGGSVWLRLRDGKVVGAMGSDPDRFVGLTLAEAKHVARYGGAKKAAKKAPAKKAAKKAPAKKAAKKAPAKKAAKKAPAKKAAKKAPAKRGRKAAPMDAVLLRVEDAAAELHGTPKPTKARAATLRRQIKAAQASLAKRDYFSAAEARDAVNGAIEAGKRRRG